MLVRVVVDPEILMNENVILSTYAVPLLVSGKVLFKNLKILQSYGGGLFFFFFLRWNTDLTTKQNWKYLGELLACDFPGRSYIPPDAKTSVIWGNFYMVGVKLKRLSCSCFYSTFSIMTLTESLFIKFADNTELGETASMLRAELAFKMIWINWEIVWNNWMKSNRDISTRYWT